MNLPFIIAIDGPAASGKSTIAEKIAKKLGYLYFDTGVMYRAVTLAALESLHSVDDEVRVSELARSIHIDVSPSSVQDGRKFDVLLDGKDITNEIRTSEVDKNVSAVSAYRDVRAAMTAQQQIIGRRGRVVMVGRDIGTVVLPEADLKIYLEASLEERARRRFCESKSKKNDKVTYEEIYDSLAKRDVIDTTRDIAPLQIAKDAFIVNSDEKTIDEVLELIWQKIEGE